jgi:transposase-like protein
MIMSNTSVGSRKKRRLLSPSQKYELYVSVLTGQCTQRDAALQWKVDRTTVAGICRTAKQGVLDALSARPAQPGKSSEQLELEDARAETERLRATVAEQAVALHLHEGKASWD